jgi:protein SCO1/2
LFEIRNHKSEINTEMSTRSYWLLGVAILLGLGVTLGIGILGRPYTYQGSYIDPPVLASDFQLTDQNGQSYRLSGQQGKAVIMFFGYTNCPDICPATLAEFKQVKEKLGDQASQVNFVFVTVDPERDTADRLRSYLANFDPGFTGLTGSQANLEAVWKAYGVYVAKGDFDTMEHNARIYAIDRQGNLRLTYPYDTGAVPIASDLTHLLSGK